jgi:hypothetical protein
MLRTTYWHPLPVKMLPHVLNIATSCTYGFPSSQRFDLSNGFKPKRFSVQSTNNDTIHGEANIPRDVYLIESQLERDSSRDKYVII